MYEKLKQLIHDLETMHRQPFIGYGKPDADILIVGKECAETEGSKNWKLFYEPNFAQWKESFEGHGFGYTHGQKPYDFEHGNFHPIFPFYEQCNKIDRNKKGCGTSSTYYYYQRLIDMVRAGSATQYEKSPNIDFFNACFITELNDICRPNGKNRKKKDHEKIEQHIRYRFDWMRTTNFFNTFKVVILACGPYSKAIKEDKILEKDLFGDALIIYCHQLSYWDKFLNEKIAEIGKKLCFEK